MVAPERHPGRLAATVGGGLGGRRTAALRDADPAQGVQEPAAARRRPRRPSVRSGPRTGRSTSSATGPTARCSRPGPRPHLRDRVRWRGTSSGPDHAFAEIDVLCVPSGFEAFPLVMVEAMTRAVPVMASASGTVPEMLDHGRAGVVVEPVTREAWTAALRTTLDDRAGLGRLGALGARACARALHRRRDGRRLPAGLRPRPGPPDPRRSPRRGRGCSAGERHPGPRAGPTSPGSPRSTSRSCGPGARPRRRR